MYQGSFIIRFNPQVCEITAFSNDCEADENKFPKSCLFFFKFLLIF